MPSVIRAPIGNAFETDAIRLLMRASSHTQLRVPGHVEDFTHGIVDTRQVFFYLTGCVLSLIFSILGVEAKILNS